LRGGWFLVLQFGQGFWEGNCSSMYIVQYTVQKLCNITAECIDLGSNGIRKYF
jgi:hypothetical protein